MAGPRPLPGACLRAGAQERVPRGRARPAEGPLGLRVSRLPTGACGRGRPPLFPGLCWAPGSSLALGPPSPPTHAGSLGRDALCLLLGSERELLTIEWPRTGSRRQTLSGGCRGAGAGAVATCSGPWARLGTVLSNPSLHLHTSGCHGPGRPSPRAWSPQRRLYLVWPAPWEGEARSADSEPAFSQPLHTGPPLHVSVYPDRPRAPLPRTRDAGSGGDGTDGRTDGASGGCRGHTHRRPAGPRVVSPELLLPVGRACRLSGRSHPA